MKVYEVNGRKVWLNEPHQGYVEPKKEEKTVKAEPTAEIKPKAKKAPQNKSRKAGADK